MGGYETEAGTIMENSNTQSCMSESQYGSINTSSAKFQQGEKTSKLKWQLLAYIMTTSSMSLYCLSVVSVQILAGSVPDFELNGFRFLTQAAVALPVILYKNCDFKVPVSKLGLMTLIIILFMIYNVTYYGAAVYLPLGTLAGVVNSIAIAGNSLLSICIVRERSLQLYIAAVFAIIGIMLMTQPDFMFKNAGLPPPPIVNWISPCKTQHPVVILNSTFNTSMLPGLNYTEPFIDNNENLNLDNDLLIGYILVLITGISDSIWIQSIGALVQHVSPFIMAFWVGIFGSGISFLIMAIMETPVFPNTPLCIGLLFMHCIGATQIAIVIPWSVQHISPSLCTMVNSLYLVVLLLLQYTALEDIKPGLQNWVEILGAVICLLAVVIGPMLHLWKNRSTKKILL